MGIIKTNIITNNNFKYLIKMKNNQNITILQKSNLLGREFTIYGTAETPLFLAKDVAEMIGHSNITKMTLSVDEEERVIGRTNDSLGRENGATFLTEDGLYEVLMLSRKPNNIIDYYSKK